MSFIRSCLVFVIAGLLASAPFLSAETVAKPSATASAQKFGPYEVLTFDKAVLFDVKVDEKGDIYLMLQPDQVAAQITIKISMQKGAAYRKWFNGEESWVAQQNSTGRTAGVWSDRVQTSATYIEYWVGGKCFLHLKKMSQ
ncbi:MAG: hypothetical protein WC205_01980 [Opitutaceae bacterium]|jgi:hypothetical protein